MGKSDEIEDWNDIVADLHNFHPNTSCRTMRGTR
jgi:hypothetical protein